MTFTLTIEMDNAAFFSDLYLYNSKELQRVLRAVGEQADRETQDHFIGPFQLPVDYGRPVLDFNGTSVGRWTLQSD